jgi:hypothetical protein
MASENQIKGEYTSEMGCISSYADAKHDFLGEVFSGPGAGEKIKSFVKANIPSMDCRNDHMDENGFLLEYILDKQKSSPNLTEMKAYFTQDQSPLTPDLFHQSIKDRYIIHTIYRPQHDDTDQDKSKIQHALNVSNVTNDIFIVCDVGYANVREDITLINNSENTNPQKFYWVQNAQTLYDPAGKTSWHTGKNYGFQDNTSKFIFCWENANKKAITYFPCWTTESKVEFNAASYPEKLLYTNKNLYLSIKAEPNKTKDLPKDQLYNNYSNHEAYLIITDPNKPRYFAYADKVLSSRGTGILNASQMSGYLNKGAELNLFVKLLINTGNTDIPGEFLDEVDKYNSNYQILAKKVGDASQSLSCCKKTFELQQFKDRTQGLDSKHQLVGEVENFQSNGLHMFVSFDRIAIGCALNYNSPLVLQNSEEGFILYIRQDLINIDNQAKPILEPKTLVLYNIRSFDDSANDATATATATNAIDQTTDINVFFKNIYLFMIKLEKNRVFLKTLTKITIDGDSVNSLIDLKKADASYQLLLSKILSNKPIFELTNLLSDEFISLQLINKSEDEIRSILTNTINRKMKEFIENTIQSLNANSTGETTNFDFTGFNIFTEATQNKIWVYFSQRLAELKQTYDEMPEKDGPETKVGDNVTFPVKEEKKRIIKTGGIINNVFNFINVFFKNIENTNNTIDKIYQLWNKDGIPSLKKTEVLNDSDYLLSVNLPKFFTKAGYIPFSALYPSQIRFKAENFLSKCESIFAIIAIIIPVITSMRSSFFQDEQKHLKDILLNTFKYIKNIGGESDYSKLIVTEAISSIESIKIQDELQEEETEETVEGPETHTYVDVEKNEGPETQTDVDVEKVVEEQPAVPIQNSLRKNEGELRKKNFLIKNLNPGLDIKISSFIESLQENKLHEWIKKPDTLDNQTILDDIKHTSKELQTFLKGFFGICLFVDFYRKVHKTRFPVIIKKKRNGSLITYPESNEMFHKFTEITSELFFNDTINFIKSLITLKQARTTRTTNKEKRLTQLIDSYKDSVVEYERYVELYRSENIEGLKLLLASMNEYDLDSEEDDLEEDDSEDANPDEYTENLFYVNPFFSIIDSNQIGFDEKQLTGEYEGYNANEFNFNVLFLNYIDFKIKKNPEDSEFILYKDLFDQLFPKKTFVGGSTTDTDGNIVSEDTREISIELPEFVSTIIGYFLKDDSDKSEITEINHSSINMMKTTFEILLNCPKKLILDKFNKIITNTKPAIVNTAIVNTVIVNTTLEGLYRNYPLIFHTYPALFIDKRTSFFNTSKQTEIDIIKNYIETNNKKMIKKENDEDSYVDDTSVTPYSTNTSDSLLTNDNDDELLQQEILQREILQRENLFNAIKPNTVRVGAGKKTKKRHTYRNKKTNKKRRTYRNKKYVRKTRKY